MKYLYTTIPDEGCTEIEPGVFGRPVHTYQEAGLRKLGWTTSIESLRGNGHVREEKEGREEGQEVSDRMGYDDFLRQKYENVFGKKPHHKMKRDTMQEKIAEAEADDSNSV